MVHPSQIQKVFAKHVSGNSVVKVVLGKELDKSEFTVYGSVDDRCLQSVEIPRYNWEFQPSSFHRLGNQFARILVTAANLNMYCDVSINVVSAYNFKKNIDESEIMESVIVSPLIGDEEMTYSAAIQILPNSTGFYAVANKDVFYVNEPLNINDFSLFYLSRGSILQVPLSGYTVLGFEEAVAQPGQGLVSVVGTYSNQKTDCSVYITVIKKGVPVSPLSITTTRDEYTIGQAIDKKSITVKYLGTEVAENDWSYTGMDSRSTGLKTITVYYDLTQKEHGGIVTATFTVNVTPADTVVLSAVTTKGVYRRGEAFDYGSLIVTKHLPDGTDIPINPRQGKVVGFSTTSASNIEPYFEFEGLRAPINVIV
jgi:hypothetical protein